MNILHPKRVETCSRCSTPLGGNRCSKCGAWNWGETPAEVTSSVVRYEDISERELERISLGVLNRCLDVVGWEKGKGGIVKSDILIVGGGPGGGKSTLCLGAAASICRLGECLYVAAEEDLPAIATRGKRLGIDTRGNLTFLPAIGGGVDLLGVIYERKPKGLILDSIDGFVNHDPAAEVALLYVLKKACVLLQFPAIVISQVNKDLDYSGFQSKKHTVDVLLTLTADPDLQSENGEKIRVLETTDKNRNGRAYVKTFLEMTETGLTLWDSPEEGIENGVELPEEEC